MQAHFISLFNVDRDADLIGHWVAHYLSLGFDHYYIFVHSPEGRGQEFVSRFRDLGMNATEVKGDFRTGGIRQECLSMYHASVASGNPEDWVFCADSDEIHHIPPEWRKLARDYDSIEGEFIERWSETPAAADSAVPLPDQYPFYGGLTHSLTGITVCTRKVCGTKAAYMVAYAGSHCYAGVPAFQYKVVKKDYENIPGSIFNGVAIDHYCWRSDPIARMQNKVYYRLEHVVKVMEHFGMHDHPLLSSMIHEEWERQVDMGWNVNGVESEEQLDEIVRSYLKEKASIGNMKVTI